MIEETCDVEFDETNGSQGEVFSCDDVGDEPLRESHEEHHYWASQAKGGGRRATSLIHSS